MENKSIKELVMKKILPFSLTALLGLFFTNCFGDIKPEGKKSKVSFWSLTFNTIDGSVVPMSTYKGKKVLIVNTASKCGYTPQYDELEKLSKKYKDKLVVIGFPANNFLSQEPGSNTEIQQFCKINYGVTFQLSEKISVVGDDKHSIFCWLTNENLNGWNNSDPKWNFYKYLIDESGELIRVYPSKTKPLSEELVSEIEK